MTMMTYDDDDEVAVIRWEWTPGHFERGRSLAHSPSTAPRGFCNRDLRPMESNEPRTGTRSRPDGRLSSRGVTISVIDRRAQTQLTRKARRPLLDTTLADERANIVNDSL